MKESLKCYSIVLVIMLIGLNFHAQQFYLRSSAGVKSPELSANAAWNKYGGLSAMIGVYGMHDSLIGFGVDLGQDLYLPSSSGTILSSTIVMTSVYLPMPKGKIQLGMRQHYFTQQIQAPELVGAVNDRYTSRWKSVFWSAGLEFSLKKNWNLYARYLYSSKMFGNLTPGEKSRTMEFGFVKEFGALNKRNLKKGESRFRPYFLASMGKATLKYIEGKKMEMDHLGFDFGVQTNLFSHTYLFLEAGAYSAKASPSNEFGPVNDSQLRMKGGLGVLAPVSNKMNFYFQFGVRRSKYMAIPEPSPESKTIYIGFSTNSEIGFMVKNRLGVFCSYGNTRFPKIDDKQSKLDRNLNAVLAGIRVQWDK